MLKKFRVKFRHHAFVEGREVDFLIPRPGRPGLLLEVDGDIFHFDLDAKAAKDKILTAAGWDVMHFWGSEVLHTPKDVAMRIKAELVGVPRLPKKKKRKSPNLAVSLNPA